jgi:transcriptional regulator with XRE-family HTH domain
MVGMTLSEFIQLNQLTHEQFASISGVPRPTVTRLLKPGARPKWKHIRAIAKATAGKVTANDWMAASDEVAA